MHQQLTGTDLPTSPVCCNHCTLRNIKSDFSTILFICTFDYLHYLRIKWTVTEIVKLLITPEKCHHTTLWNAELIHLMEGTLFPPSVGGCEKASRVVWHCWLWKEPVVRCGNLNVRQATSQQVFILTAICIDTRLQSFSPLINFIVHHAVLLLPFLCVLPSLLFLLLSLTFQNIGPAPFPGWRS